MDQAMSPFCVIVDARYCCAGSGNGSKVYVVLRNESRRALRFDPEIPTCQFTRFSRSRKGRKLWRSCSGGPRCARGRNLLKAF